jgi:RNA polymerase sigma-70 factor (ECF subfamily)
VTAPAPHRDDHDDPVAEAVPSVVAAERAQLVATLIRLTGDWDLAEDCVQDAVEKALARWPRDGVPQSPGAWLTTVARRRALDVLRRRRTERAKVQEIAVASASPSMSSLAGDTPDALSDDLLRLIFTCCHPALALENRVALTLRTVAGLSTGEIARAFLVSEATMSQRLRRTKAKIAHAGIPYRVPPDDLLAERTGGVLAVLYLVFNEGYGRASPRLSTEAVRLARLLADLMPHEAEARGLLALMVLQEARRSTRFDRTGDLVPMEDQDRSRWDRALIDEGVRHLRVARLAGRPPGPYRLQAEIAMCHATAPDAASTPWDTIVTLFDALLVARPSPVIELNRAIAVGFRDGYAAGLRALDALSGLDGYAFLPAARGDFLRRLGRAREARSAYGEAVALSRDGSPERRLLERRLAELWAEPDAGGG